MSQFRDIDLRENTTLFNEDVSKGTRGERYFLDHFITPNNLRYDDISDEHIPVDFRIQDSSNTILSVDIKNNYKDNEKIVIEEWVNINSRLGKLIPGWVFKTNSDFIISISERSGDMIFINMKKFKPFFQDVFLNDQELTDQCPLIKNTITIWGNGWRNQCAFRMVPFRLFPKGSLKLYNEKTYPNFLKIN